METIIRVKHVLIISYQNTIVNSYDSFPSKITRLSLDDGLLKGVLEEVLFLLEVMTLRQEIRVKRTRLRE